MHKKSLFSFKYIGYLLIIVVLTVLDQLTKVLAVDNFKNKEPFVIWDGVFELTYVENRGAAFGVQQGMIPMFVIITLLIVPALIFLIYKSDKIIATMGKKVNKKAYSLLQITFVILIAGAIGNLIDRLLNGFVVDFLYFKLIDFPVFNVADCYVTVATIAFILIGFFMLNDKELDYLIGSQKKWPVNDDEVDTDNEDK